MSDAELRAEALRDAGRPLSEAVIWEHSQATLGAYLRLLRETATKARALADRLDVLAEHQLRDAGVSAAHAELREALARLREVER